MPGHGDHWSALYDMDDYLRDGLARDCQNGQVVSRAQCMDVKYGTERAEEVVCLRYGSDRLANQILLVSDSTRQSHFLFSGYPVALDGIVHPLKIRSVESWEYGLEGWIHAAVTSEEIPLSFFDTMFFMDSALLRPGDFADYALAGLAYWLRPIHTRVFEICEGPLWELEKQRRLEKGESPEQAQRPVEIHRDKAAILLPLEDGRCDDAQFQGVIEAVDVFEHDGQTVYRLDMVVLRASDEEFRLPVYAAKRVLGGYVPRLGDAVEGEMWLQGMRIGANACTSVDCNIERIDIE